MLTDIFIFFAGVVTGVLGIIDYCLICEYIGGKDIDE